MKKREVLFVALAITFLLIASSVVIADENDNVAKAYKCLYEKIDDKNCSKMSTEEKIFALLSTGKCKSELLDDSFNETCWPASSCSLEKTAKATLALENAGLDTDLPSAWLLEQKGVSDELRWYLQIDSGQTLSCKVIYGDPIEEYSFIIGEDKKIDRNAGECLTRANNDYWFAISSDCYENEFQITCNGTFISTLAFREESSSTYHISREVQSSSEDSTIEKINSYCFLGSDGKCDYTGSLWATMVLDNLGENVTDFMPYLSLSAPEYESSFPEPFLYILTGKVKEKTDLLNKQIFKKYWEIPSSVGRYYDTALALLPFQGETLEQKENTKNWLFSVQQEDGCWDNDNIVSNAFILYSLWSKSSGHGEVTPGEEDDILCSEMGYTCVDGSDSCSGTTKPQYICSGDQICCDDSSSGGDDLTECETEGYTCEYSSTCTSSGGNILSDYSCGASIKKCCDTEPVSTTCSEEGGITCSSDETCTGGSNLFTDELSYGESCCLKPGTCEKDEEGYTCETNLGYCDSSCDSGYEESNDYTCESSSDVCCVSKGSSKNYAWVWILLALIVITTLAIIYREKIKEIIQKTQAKRSKGGNSPSSMNKGIPPRFPPSYVRQPARTMPAPRKIIPRPTPVQKPIPKRKTPQELDEVLKKLKEIGN